MAATDNFRLKLRRLPDVMLRQLDADLADEIETFQRGSTPHAARMISRGTEKRTTIADELEHRRIAGWPSH